MLDFNRSTVQCALAAYETTDRSLAKIRFNYGAALELLLRKEIRSRGKFVYERVHLGEAATFLGGVSEYHLKKIFTGKLDIKPETIATIRKFGWREKLAQRNPRMVKLLGEYDACFSVLEAYAYSKKIPAYEPEDKQSPGHALWKIIGGPNADIEKTALLLGIKNPNHLFAYIHGTKKLTEDILKRRGLREILKTAFPEAWESNAPDFDKRVVAEAEQRAGRPCMSSPEASARRCDAGAKPKGMS